MERAPGEVLARPAQNARVHAGGPARRSASSSSSTSPICTPSIRPPSGLEDFGRPDGYLARQLSTWRRQLDASRSRETPALDALQDEPGRRDAGIRPLRNRARRLSASTTPSSSASGDDPHISAILDWEMATLGDPFVDLGIFALYWDIASLPGGLAGAVPSAVDPAAGYPAFDELVEVYAERAGIGIPDLRWYRAFAAYKLAVILEGIHFRYQAGDTVGDGIRSDRRARRAARPKGLEVR